MVRGKLGESIKIQSLFHPEVLGSETVWWNGGSITSNSGYLLDTRDYDNVEIVVDAGTVVGPLATLMNDVYESETDDPTALSAISGAEFDDITPSSDEALQEGHIKCKDTKRYLGLKTELQGSPATAHFSAYAVLGLPDSQAVSKTFTFDL